MTTNVAFFPSRSGELIYVPLNDISTVIADPQRFGLTRGRLTPFMKNMERDSELRVRPGRNSCSGLSTRIGFFSNDTQTSIGR